MRRLVVLAALALSACSPGACSPGGVETAPQGDTPVATPDGGLPADPGPPVPEPVTWPHEPPGGLVAGSGTGATDPTVWAPGMRFPMEAGPAYANSQVYGYGGFAAPGPGGQCDARNYAYPWRDNFCETRGWTNTMCPTGKGHQGQDIRPATCVKRVHGVVAAEAGVITSIGSYSVFLRGDSGRIYRYLHMDPAHVQTILTEGQRVTRGQLIGKDSDAFGGSTTTLHLHFEIKAPVTANGSTAVIFVPTYPSLEDSYARLLNAAA
ncbi:MAG: M23 family metallopeptidase [Brevundimonas sp.]|uniref:M23 family metallopeptidase n=1 Tax=Brevundimonas sp. TaxID=1871086 RepID=UPI002736B12D|nr:M23 family metallopeptidase [Brevundimonas sp.]MDP3406115.1 M23 family metallopeptidase [Brevundimonas sp.]